MLLSWEKFRGYQVGWKNGIVVAVAIEQVLAGSNSPPPIISLRLEYLYKGIVKRQHRGFLCLFYSMNLEGNVQNICSAPFSV